MLQLSRSFDSATAAVERRHGEGLMDRIGLRAGRVCLSLLLSSASVGALAQTAEQSPAQGGTDALAPERMESPADAAVATLTPEVSQDILVTGSRIVRNDASSLGPLTTITAQDIALTAPTSVGDIVQALPNVGVSLNSNGTQGTSFGVSTVNLRYLGSAEGSGNRTLVLVDGHRWVNAVGGRGFRDFVDLNTIPLGIVERIEVLKDGASAIYGADAIAGVVNVQTRRNVEGLQGNARFGITERGDNQNVSGYLNWGTTTGSLSALVSLSYSDTKPLLTGARPLTARALTPLTAPPTSPRGLYVLPGLANNAFFGTPAAFGNNAANALTRISLMGNPGAGAAADNAFRVARLPDDDYNTQAQGIYATGPSTRYGVFGRLGFDFGNGVTGRVEGLYNHRTSSQLFSPFLLDIRGSNGFSISRDHPHNPFGTANGVPTANALAFSGNTFRIQRVATEVGNRDNVQEVETWRFAAGLEGGLHLMGEWRWDLFLSYSRNSATFDAFNQINLESLFRALHSPQTCAAAPGCVPLNIFGEITPQMANYIRFNGHDENRATQHNFAANVSRQLFNLPGGPIGFAAGYEYRRESAVDDPDLFAATLSSVLPLVGGQPQLPTTAQAREPTRGSYDLHEVYSELNLPLLADIPGVHRLDVDVAARYSHYSTVGGRLTTKIGAAYRPVPDFMLRGTFAQGFRAPSILELYQGERQTNFQAVDPCNLGGGNLPGCAGVPASYHQNQFGSGALSGVTSGNADLQAETANTFSAGIAFTPGFIPRLSLTVDWFRINVKDAIAAQSAAQILTSCARTGNFCELVQRAPSGEVLRLSQAVVNLSRIEVQGVDATLRYAIPTDIGRFEGVLDVSYLERFRTFTPQPDGTTLMTDRAGLSDQPRSTFPRWKGQGSIRWLGDGMGFNWRTRYIGSTRDIPNNAVNGGRVTDVFYHDIQFNVTTPDERMNFAIGVDNLFDRQPPASAANNPMNFDIYTYDVRGRYFYATAGFRF
jgi:iron complex outermembrane recepter protein